MKNVENIEKLIYTGTIDRRQMRGLSPTRIKHRQTKDIRPRKMQKNADLFIIEQNEKANRIF